MSPAFWTVTVILPVATAQVGCVNATTGAEGVRGCDDITTSAESAEVHPAAFVTLKLYVPGASDDTVALAPDPAIAPGFIVQLPAGRLFRTTLPVGTVHVGCVGAAGAGAGGSAFTVSAYVATAAEHGDPEGLLVVTVMVTVFPASPAEGVYVNENGEVPDDDGFTVPVPLLVIVTLVAFVKVLPLTVTGAEAHVLPLREERTSPGPLTQPHATGKLVPVVVHPAAFLTVIA